MAFNIDQFRANLIGGGARANYFVVRGNFPGTGSGIVNAAASAAGAVFGGGGAAGAGIAAGVAGAAAIGGGNPNNQIQFLCKSASIPAVTLGEVTVAAPGGRTLKLAGDRSFENWELTVYNDATFGLRNAFEKWSNLINDISNNIGPDSLDGYAQNWSVTQLSRDGSEVKTYDFVGCWPMSIGSIALSFDQQTAIEEFSVTIAYQYYISQGVNQ
jgi:hypothetical protein